MTGEAKTTKPSLDDFSFEIQKKNQSNTETSKKIVDIISNDFDKNKIHNLPNIDKILPLKEKLNILFENNILYENPDGRRYIKQLFWRMAVIVNINGVKIPFYQSSRGTDEKNKGKWYAFLGNRGSWLIKNDSVEQGYNIPEIKNMMNYLDKIISEDINDIALTKEQQIEYSRESNCNIAEQIQEIKPDFLKEIMFGYKSTSQYMAQILEYYLEDAPGDKHDEKVNRFIETIIDSIKNKLQQNK